MASALRQRLKLVFGLIILLCAVFLLNQLLGGQLNGLGVVPRRLDSLYHVVTAPFIHSSVGHLMNNIMGLSIFSSLCLLRSMSFFIGSSLFIIILSGALVWLFGRDAFHIGASGWIFGLWSLSIAIAFFDRSVTNILIALIVVFFYGGLIYGVLPSMPGVSFESHLAGTVSGVVLAFLYSALNKGG